MISYAQNREDVLLDRLFPGPEPGFYIDVGANDPVQHSVTKHFYDRGWRGINVEPHPACFERLCRERPRDVNLNVGLSDRVATLTFFEARDASGWSTFSTAQAANLRKQGMALREHPIPVMTLAALCEEYVEPSRSIDFLKVDAESFEREVLLGADWRRWRPRAVLVEENGSETWEVILLGADYLLAAIDGVNRYYLRMEDRDLLPRLAKPANVTDAFVPYESVRELEALQDHYQHAIAELRDRSDREIQTLRNRLAPVEDLGPTALALAWRLQQLARRFPRLTAALKSIRRRAAESRTAAGPPRPVRTQS